ncbi:TLC domain-containing protein [Parasitella parasitica]|nr:TLC domain-containing protein [Parasitella parasitica]
MEQKTKPVPTSDQKHPLPSTPKLCSIKNTFLKYEAELSGSVVLSVVIYHLLGNPLASQLLYVSHQVGPNEYDKGFGDVYFVFFWTIMFTFLRAAFIKYIYLPLSSYFNIGVASKRQRVAEQSYILAYYVVFGSAGMYIMYNSPHWFNTSQFWIDYPHVLISSDMKKYYLMQLAFWIQQIYGLHIEKRRKDHVAMLSHHIITIILVGTSYISNLTRVGNAVLCCMDLCDIFLSLAKILKYLGFTNVCNIAFGLFAISWPITRHIFFSIVTWSVAVEPARYFDMEWNPSQGKYFTIKTQRGFVALLLALNLIMFYWFLMIVKVIAKLFTGNEIDDTRSDDEDESDVDSDEFQRNSKVSPDQEKKPSYSKK